MRRPALIRGLGAGAAAAIGAAVLFTALAQSSSPATMADSFPALSGARSAADALPAADARALSDGAPAADALNAQSSKLIVTTGTMKVWLMPGAAQSCLVADDGQAVSVGCAPNASVQTDGILGVDGSTVYGALPAKAGAVTVTLPGGGTQTLAAGSAGGFARTLTAAPTRLSYAAADGTARVLTPSSPPPGQ